MTNKKLWQDLGICLLITVGIFLFADNAYAQLEDAADKITTLTDQVFRILRALFILAFVVIGYLWVKGSPDARSRLEKGLVGVIVAGASTEVVNFFMGA